MKLKSVPNAHRKVANAIDQFLQRKGPCHDTCCEGFDCRNVLGADDWDTGSPSKRSGHTDTAELLEAILKANQAQVDKKANKIGCIVSCLETFGLIRNKYNQLYVSYRVDVIYAFVLAGVALVPLM